MLIKPNVAILLARVNYHQDSHEGVEIGDRDTDGDFVSEERFKLDNVR